MLAAACRASLAAEGSCPPAGLVVALLGRYLRKVRKLDRGLDSNESEPRMEPYKLRSHKKAWPVLARRLFVQPSPDCRTCCPTSLQLAPFLHRCAARLQDLRLRLRTHILKWESKGARWPNFRGPLTEGEYIQRCLPISG